MRENSEQFTTNLIEEQLRLYFLLNEFYSKEAEAYSKFIQQESNHRVYVQIMSVEVQQFPGTDNNTRQQEPTRTALGYESGSEEAAGEYGGTYRGDAIRRSSDKSHDNVNLSKKLSLNSREYSIASPIEAIKNEYGFGLGSMASQGSQQEQVRRRTYTSNTSLNEQQRPAAQPARE